MKKFIWVASVVLVGSLFSLSTPNALASNFARVDADLKIYDSHVGDCETEFAKIPAGVHDREWVKQKLAHMFEVDQYVRQFYDVPLDHQYTAEEKNAFEQEFGPRAAEMNRRNTADLKALLDVYYWFNISSFGPIADNQAWLIAQHADQEVEFQEMVLSRLQTLYKKGETRPQNYAYLFDRVASSFSDPSKRLLQRYGTQGACVGPGKWLPWPVESERDLDRYRKDVGLAPEADYIASFKETCR